LRYQLSSNLEVLTVRGVPVDTIERVLDLHGFEQEPSIWIYNVHKMATSTSQYLELPPSRQYLVIDVI
jgi:hypothetical protein